MSDPTIERRTLRSKWPGPFDDGARCGFTRHHDGPREPGGYPVGFHSWPLEKRNAWFAGYNAGVYDRARLEREEA